MPLIAVRVVKYSAWETFLRKTQQDATQELGPSALETPILDVGLHVTTHIVNNNISMILDTLYINIFLALMSILLQIQLLLYSFDTVHLKFLC